MNWCLSRWSIAMAVVGVLVLWGGADPLQAPAPGIKGNYEWLKDEPSTHQRGKVKVVEFADFYCPHCLKDGTRIEILQLPLGSSLQPSLDRTQSQGRFVAVQQEFLDPATIPPGTFVTVTGDIGGSVTLPLDETEYTYPLVEVRSLRVWEPQETALRFRPYPYMGPGPYWSPYWSPYRRSWPYYW